MYEDEIQQLTTKSFTDNEDFKVSPDTSLKLTNDQLLWNILPSYDLYRDQFLEAREPPNYDDNQVQEELFSSTSAGPSSLSTYSSDMDTVTSTENKILDNIDHLANLTSTPNIYAKRLNVKIHFTKDLVQRDKPYELIEPGEYKPGDTINGFITIHNTLGHDIQFSSFYVSLEGIAILNIGNTNKQVKFLEMFDLFSSYHQGSINRLVTNYELNFCTKRVDSEGYHETFLSKKICKGCKYKRFFSFKVPHQILDHSCKEGIPSHLNILPTLGHVKDFSHVGDSIRYQVSTLTTGKAAYYGVNNVGEYVILNKTHSEITVIPTSNLSNDHQIDLIYHSFMKLIDDKIKVMEKVSLVGCSDVELIESVENQLNLQEANKLPQLYYPLDNKSSTNTLDLQIKNTSVFKRFEATLSTPGTSYNLPYPVSGKLHIPISIQSHQNSKIKTISVELSIVTFKSMQPIPLEFNHSMIFQNSKPNVHPIFDRDTFTYNVNQKFIRKLGTLKMLGMKTKIENFKIEKKLLTDLQTLSDLSSKTINLAVRDAKFVQDGKLVQTPKLGNFEIIADMDSLFERGGREKFSLGPSFQSCFIGRIYYLRIWVSLNNGDFCFKLPVFVTNGNV